MGWAAWAIWAAIKKYSPRIHSNCMYELPHDSALCILIFMSIDVVLFDCNVFVSRGNSYRVRSVCAITVGYFISGEYFCMSIARLVQVN